jgi:hypothetical protein
MSIKSAAWYETTLCTFITVKVQRRQIREAVEQEREISLVLCGVIFVTHFLWRLSLFFAFLLQ